MVIPGVEKKISLPRLKTGKMLQKRKENPGVEDSKGNFNYDEKSLDPVDFMAFTVFNPRTFENIWRKWQPGILGTSARSAERPACRVGQAGTVRTG